MVLQTNYIYIYIRIVPFSVPRKQILSSKHLDRLLLGLSAVPKNLGTATGLLEVSAGHMSKLDTDQTSGVNDG